MSVCEQCWNDASAAAASSGGSVIDHYTRLLEERKDNPCGLLRDDHVAPYVSGLVDEIKAAREALRSLRESHIELRLRVKASIAAVEDLPDPDEGDVIRSTLEHVLSDMDELGLGKASDGQ